MDRSHDFQPFLPRAGVRPGFVERVGDGSGWPESLAWAIFAILLVLLAIAIVSVALDVLRSRGGPKPFVRPPGAGVPAGALAGGQALSILGVRYARGEISRDEFLRAKDDLGAIPDEAPTDVVPGPEPPNEGRSPSSS